MRQTERVADGRRRFFAASGVVSDVLLRGNKSHRDVGLERGRDYEIETGGVSLRTVPPAGSTVIILTGDRVVEVDGGQGSTPAVIGPSASAFGLSPGHNVSIHVAATDEQPTTPPTFIQRDRSNDPTDIRELQDVLTMAAAETCEGVEGRTAEWQDEFARLTAVMRAAQTIDGVYAAFADIEAFLKGQP